MRKEETILTLHPNGKKGVNILKRRYDFIAEYILKTIKNEKVISFEALCDKAEQAIATDFDGKILWYMVTVKLDLEARKLIERIPKTSPHELRLVNQ
ncbi:MAG: hypothetical protein RH860_02325 [Cytophagales bacterium]